MRILLVSDTHGHINKIAEYAGCINAKFCIHAGDFGFYDANSCEALTRREAYLQIKHSELPENEKSVILKKDLSFWKQVISEKHLLGNFYEYMLNEKMLGWQTYAVWGNHDDAKVISRLLKSPIENLHLLHDKDIVDCEEFYLLGLGGNCTPEKDFCHNTSCIPGSQCRPSSVLNQYISLLQTAQKLSCDKPKVLVTHVSPLVEPFLELVAWQIGATLTISGHMGYPDGQIGKTDSKDWRRLNEIYKNLCQKYPEAEKHLELLRPEKKDGHIQHINLPDAEVGYAILDVDEKKFSYSIRGKTFFDNLFSKNKELAEMSRSVQRFAALEYERLLPISKKIISGRISDAKEIETAYEHMLNSLGAPFILEMFLKCCDYTEKHFPELTKFYREMYRSMYEESDDN